MDTEADAPGADGRTARRDRNRQAVLDAVLALFAEGITSPTPDEVARRSGVSLRSVYRYVRDRDELLRQAIEVHLERVRPLAVVEDLGRGTLDERIDRLVATRLRLYDSIAATARASAVLERTNKVVHGERAAARRSMRVQFERQFAPELSELDVKTRRSVIAAGDALLQMDSLEYLRHHRNLSARDTSEHLRFGLHAILSTGTNRRGN